MVKAGIGGYGTRSEWGYYRVFGRRYRSQVLVALFFLGTDFGNNVADRRGRVHNGRLVPTYPYCRLNCPMKFLETRSVLYNAALYLVRCKYAVRGALNRR